MNFARRGILVAFAVGAFRASILAYGPLGHQIVGAIADERLANTPTAAKVDALTPPTATLTNSCAISGARTSQPTIPIRPRLRTTGFTTLMSR